APVRHPAPRRAGQAAPARRRPVPGGGRRARRLLGPEPVLLSLQASRRRHAWAVPSVRKNRLTRTIPAKRRRSDPLTIPNEQRGAAAISRGPQLVPCQQNNHFGMYIEAKGETMTQRETPQVIGVRHVGLSARDPAELAEFYRDVLGLQIVPVDTSALGATAFLS